MSYLESSLALKLLAISFTLNNKTMSDISMCSGLDCPVKNDCYRHTAKYNLNIRVNPDLFLKI